jgi:glycolate oxidase FAD binding subunit
MLDNSRRKRLAEIVGDEHLTTETAQLGGRWPGTPPKAIARPGNREQVCELLRLAHSERLTVAAAGGLTKQRLGGVPRAIDFILSLERMNRITDYQPADLTVTVEAGVRMADLATTLQSERQMLPLDPPFGATATVGGVIATNGSGPRRLAYGSARDMVLGIHFVTAGGTLAKSGGKVVKNVAGYDVAKLLIGSLGSLAVITDVTFKTFPTPPASAMLLCGFPSAGQAHRAAQRILHSPFAPQALDLLDREACEWLPIQSKFSAAFVLSIGAAGPEPVVERMDRELPALLQSDGPAEIVRLNGQEESDLWGGIQELTPTFLRAGNDGLGGVVIKSTVLITQIERVVTAAQRTAEENRLASAALARTGTGVVYSYIWPRTESFVEGALAIASETIVQQVELLGGRAVVEWAPASVKEKINIWGTLRDDFALMQRLKAQFDAQGILNPGRFYGGI